MPNGNEAYKSQQAALTKHSYFNLVFEYSLTCLLLFLPYFFFFFIFTRICIQMRRTELATLAMAFARCLHAVEMI